MASNSWDQHQSSDAFLPTSKHGRATVRLVPLGESENGSQSQSVGKPSSKSLISWNDVGLLLGVFACLAILVGSVFPQRAAVFLGQTNQLVVVGFCLALMAIACQKQVSLATLQYSIQSGRASLQDLETILQGQFFIAKSSMLCKAVIFLLTAVPLALSVGYKRCVGGSSTVRCDGIAGDFGATAAPGYQNIGLGLSLITETYLPFWIDPREPQCYGFNLLVASNTKSAVSDAPMPQYLDSLQASLDRDEFVLLTTTVNATVPETVQISTSLRNNNTYWQQLATQYGPGNWADMDMLYGRHVVVANGPSGANCTTSYLSIYNETGGQTVGGERQQTFNSRREATGTWKITPSSIRLVNADILETQDEALFRRNQSLIDDNQIDVVGLSSRFAAEYDWTRNPRNSSVSTAPTLAVTFLWARIVAQCGVENNGRTGVWREVNQYTKASSEVQVYRQRETLRRSWELLLVFLVLPVVSLFAFLAKMWFHSCPVDDGFGLISVLAAVDSKSLSGLYGAGLSGKLTQRVGIRFDVADDERVEAHVGEVGRPRRLRRGRMSA
ncbi:hypothetical protein M409DRAFT_29227 [Zasmidium cellare ATCC 36951]|uniref:Transmembrane protein n=1 Tax=Zasmidium cellare ATCC 36951 TaxID=1080233 RepID=A0A6A6C3Q8_ZASCE|nr:uncharacterized protein M409DRAFT_29227 [Zasmidium cellare ATCC 36951]KAF2160379.1 hypothetical protein M409DRAFT_29227 [Zasmidium cellare ATCC 36951]